MKSCPTCRRLFPDDAGFCPVDGVELLNATDVPPEPSEDDTRIGSLVAERYQIRRVVADGGMGRVYEALDLPGNRRVALKILHPDVSRDEVALARFKREYEISKLLPHDYIVEVFDFLSLADGGYALSMDFLEGEELRAVLKRDKTVPPARLVRMVSQMALGLDEAHKRKLVHRDLKPDNIFLCGTHDGDDVKLLDFGSAKDKSEGAKRLTVMGTTIGSPFYMSPEQAQGKESLDARADVWGMTAIIYECVTGTVPFTGSNGPSILLSIITSDPLPPSIVAETSQTGVSIPPTVDDVITRGLSKDPEHRIGSMGELASALGHAYGLDNDFQIWATTPQQQLEEQIREGLARLPAPEPQASAAAEEDPFGFPAPAESAQIQAADPAWEQTLPTSKMPVWVWILIPAILLVIIGLVIVAIFLA